MTAVGVSLKEQVTFVLGRHDPATIFRTAPDAPPDEYESEAEEILRRLTPEVREAEVRSVVRKVFLESFGKGEVRRRATRKAARDIYLVLQS